VPHSATSKLPRVLRAVFLDRDGVLNQKMPEGEYVTRWEDFHILPGVPEAISRLNRAGLLVVVVSNQRGIALGLYTAADLEAMHARFQRRLQDYGAHVDAFFICPHHKNSCNCRKPLPGLFAQAAARFPQISAATSIMIGDASVDMEFGRRLGMATILIAADPARPTPAAAESADLCFASLPQAVDALLTARRPAASLSGL
jgi:D-glycero-D-manno-heptose 1,7-bisphosphate phosphatase